MNERILCAAIHYDDGKVYEHQPTNIKTGIVIAGRRHHNCFLTLFALKGDRNINKEFCAGKEHQGFLTSHDRYLPRKEAFRVAKAAGQLLQPAVFDPNEDDVILVSEDLY